MTEGVIDGDRDADSPLNLFRMLRLPFSSSGRGPNGVSARTYADETENTMLQQHDEQLEQLNQQLEMIKMVSVDIGKEAASQNSFLDEMVGKKGLSAGPCWVLR